uniref:Zinc metalloprotease ZmpB n=1 Tax=Talaromyces marneffei PM1 TaxID=1077442 RepID=A0A093X9Z2_TALMA
METQQPPTPAQIDNWHTLGFIYAVEEEITTENPADISLESPTIPFDEDSPPYQPPSELLPSSQEARQAASSPAPVVEINADEEDDPTRCPNHAISEPLLRKRRREDVDGVDFRSKLVRR